MPEKPGTRLEAYKRWILNHRILSIIVLVGVVIIALAAFSESVWKLVDSYKRVTENDKKPEIVSSSHHPSSEELEISKVRPIIDQPTFIRDFAGTGVMTMYWELVLSNNGDKDLSVIDYDVYQMSEEGPMSYTDLRQGLYSLQDTKLQPITFPLIIPAGHSLALFIRLGVMMDKKAYELVKEEYGDEQSQSASSIIDFLRSREIDIYGNPFIKHDIGSYSLPAIDDIREPIFGVSFETARKEKTIEIISSYKYGLFRFATE